MHIAVCGAGVIGASVAYYLAQQGADVTVVERLRPGCAASGKSGGFLALDWCDGGPQEQLARASFALHEALAHALGTDYGYRRMTTLMLASSERRNVEPYRKQVAPGWLDGECVVAGHLGDENTTAQLQPLLFTQALLDAASNRGARLRTGIVEGIARSREGSTATGVIVDGEHLQADAVVLAMGPWTGTLADDLGLPPVGGLKGYSVTLRPRAAVAAHALFVEYEMEDGQQSSPEVVPRPDGEVYVCGLSGDEPVPRNPDAVSVDESKCQHLLRIAGRLSSELADATLVAQQACYRPICADAVPIIGPTPEVDGVHVATGHNCWGMLNAPATGLAMSELLLDGRSGSIDLEPFRPDRFGVTS